MPGTCVEGEVLIASRLQKPASNCKPGVPSSKTLQMQQKYSLMFQLLLVIETLTLFLPFFWSWPAASFLLCLSCPNMSECFIIEMLFNPLNMPGLATLLPFPFHPPPPFCTPLSKVTNYAISQKNSFRTHPPSLFSSSLFSLLPLLLYLIIYNTYIIT